MDTTDAATNTAKFNKSDTFSPCFFVQGLERPRFGTSAARNPAPARPMKRPCDCRRESRRVDPCFY
jgi:hypothetical protein